MYGIAQFDHILSFFFGRKQDTVWKTLLKGSEIKYDYLNGNKLTTKKFLALKGLVILAYAQSFGIEVGFETFAGTKAHMLVKYPDIKYGLPGALIVVEMAFIAGAYFWLYDARVYWPKDKAVRTFLYKTIKEHSGTERAVSNEYRYQWYIALLHCFGIRKFEDIIAFDASRKIWSEHGDNLPEGLIKNVIPNKHRCYRARLLLCFWCAKGPERPKFRILNATTSS